MKAMIFAAGLGTRLKPLTDTMPKALVPVGGKPLLERVIEKLRRSGVDEAVVNVHHFADQVEAFLAGCQDICVVSSEKTPDKMLIQVSDERKRLLETGGAILHARQYLEGCGSFLIYNVDILSDVDLKWFSSQTRDGALATLLVSDRPSSRCLLFDPDTMRLEGWMNNVTGEVRSPYPIDEEKCLKLAFSGIHMMSDSVFEAMQTYVQTHGLDISADSPRFPIIDFYIWACGRFDIYGVQADGMTLLDVGKPGALESAEELLSRGLPF